MLWYVATYEYKIIICITNCHQQLSTNIYLVKTSVYQSQATTQQKLKIYKKTSYHLAKTRKYSRKQYPKTAWNKYYPQDPRIKIQGLVKTQVPKHQVQRKSKASKSGAAFPTLVEERKGIAYLGWHIPFGFGFVPTMRQTSVLEKFFQQQHCCIGQIRNRMLATRDLSFAVLSRLATLSLSGKRIDDEGTFRRDICIVPQSSRAAFLHCQYIGLKLVYSPQQPLSHFTFLRMRHILLHLEFGP